MGCRVAGTRRPLGPTCQVITALPRREALRVQYELRVTACLGPGCSRVQDGDSPCLHEVWRTVGKTGVQRMEGFRGAHGRAYNGRSSCR